MRFIFLLVISAIISKPAYSQFDDEWFPEYLNVQPFTANFLEPKAGFNFSLGRKNIRLDIGTSTDLYHVYFYNATLSVGADLFTYTRLRSESNFHFPVETVDYFFGLNTAYKKYVNGSEVGFRFRVSHISAHLVDGQFDFSTGTWRNGRNPLVYSREFLELFPFYRKDGIRVYAGLTYLFHVVPDFIGKGIYQFGFDYYITDLRFKNFTPFIAYDFKLTRIHRYSGNNIISAGVKLGSYYSKGFSILISYFAGKSIHGEYFDLNENYATIGFNLDL